MKFRRMLAALLSALMITSCMSFVAGAQDTQTATEPVAYYTAKGAHGSFRVMGGLTKTRMYDAVEDVVFYHHTDISGGKKHYDAYGLGTVPVTNGLIYFAADIRTNYSATPSLNVYGAKLTGSTDTSGGYFSAASATKADGNWERVVVEIKNDKLESFNQNHIMLLGSSTPADFIGDKYLDVAVFGYFNDEYSALNYDFGTLIAPNGAASFSVDGAVSETVPEADPVPESGYFMGWSADDDATRGNAVTALSTVPDADTTYYAIFSGEIEDEKAVYISANGNDANSGRHSQNAVKTLAKAEAILEAGNESLNTIYIVGNAEVTTGSVTFGILDKKVYISGYTGNTDVFDITAGHIRFNGDVEFNNITIAEISNDEGWNDGGFMAQGHNITIGENVAVTGIKHISQYYYDGAGEHYVGNSASNPADSVININSGTWNGVHTGTYTAGPSFYGKSTINVDDTAKIANIKFGHGSNVGFYGTFAVNVNGGTVDNIKMNNNSKINSYKGVRYFTVNDGTVGNIYITPKVAGETQTGITVVEVNKTGALTGSIAQGAVDDAAQRIVIYNNNSYVEGQVTDAKAVVVKTIGGTVSADVTVASDYTATLNGFTYDTEFNYYDTVKIGDKEIALADLENDIIPASEFAAGVNTVEFFKIPITVVYISAAGDDENDGATAETAVASLAKAYEIVNDENNAVEEIIIVGAVNYAFPTSNAADRNLGIDGKTLTFKGIADGETAPKLSFTNPDGAVAGRIYLKGDLTFENITFDSNNTGEVPYATLTAKSITINNGVKFLQGGNKTVLVGTDYADPNPTAVDNTITINGKDFEASMINIGAGYGGDTKTGKLKLVMNGGSIPYVRLNKGSTGDKSINSTFKGTVEFEINDGTIGTELGFHQGANFNGLGYMTINGGTIRTLYTTGVNHSWASWNAVIPFPLDNLKGVMVYEINGGTVTEIKRQADTANVLAKYNSYLAGLEEPTSIEAFPDAWTAVTRVVIFNDGVEAVDVQDTDAYVLDVTGAKIEADATVAADYTATLNKFTYDVTDTTFDQVVITAGETTNTYKLADLNGEIALDKLTKGVVNEITFSKYVEAPTTATLKFYADAEAADAWVTKTVDIGATADVFPIWSDVGRETKGTNDIFAYPDNAQMHFLGWSTDGTVENIVVRETYTATADDDFYALWENLDLLTTEEITVTNIVTADDFTVPADAEKFEHLKVDGAFTGITTIYNADGTEYKAIGTGEKYPGLGGASTTINSYVGSLGSETATVLFPAGSAMYPIWMKFNDGKVIGAKTTLSGELNVAFVFNASPSDTTARGFWISAGDISGTYNLTPANTVEGGSKEYVVTLKTTLEEGDLLAYAAPYNFDNNTVKAAQLEAIYVWADAPVITKANATFDANGGAWADGETTKTVETVVGETPVAPTEAPTKTGHAFEGWTPELTAMTADGATYTAKWTANNYTVTYKVDGEVYGEVETYAYGADVTMREAPTKTGYTFSGWDKTLTTMPAENVEINGTFTANEYTVTYKVDGEVYGDVEIYEYGANVTMREAPAKTGYTFSGWDKTLTTMPAENVEINGTFTEDAEPFPSSATYKTYGKYDVLNDTYTVEVKFAGAKVNQGSFGFKFPTSYMTFKNVKANSAAGIEFLGNISPIYASGEGYYADTWAVTNMANAGNIDATTEEVLIATFTFGMTKDQRTAFETALADENYKLEEYVVENADAKYYNGTYYLATLYSTGFDTTKTPITYASHTDTETAPEITYTTYGKYDEYNGTYSIEIKVKGSKINLGAFGLAFNADHMTFDPEAENAVVFAENIANYLGITLHNAADGYAFAFDGSSTKDGYIDASTEEVLLATINLTMTPEQRAAFEAAGKTMNILVPTANETVDAETLAKYFDGENYLVSIYVAGLATPKLPAEYIKHNDEAIEATVADVDVKVTFASKNGKTVANIAQIKLDNGEAVALEAAGNEEATLTHSFKELTIGKTYTVTVEKNGYLAGVAEITVVKGENTIEMTLIAGDIKGAEADACGDGKVDLSDFVRLIRAFDTDAGDDFIATVDIDESGAVNVADLAIIKANFNNTSADNTITINGVSNNEEAAG